MPVLRNAQIVVSVFRKLTKSLNFINGHFSLAYPEQLLSQMDSNIFTMAQIAVANLFFLMIDHYWLVVLVTNDCATKRNVINLPSLGAM